MPDFNRLSAILLLGAVLVAPLAARTKKGDKLMAAGYQYEVRKQYEAALEQYELALSEDPSDPAYQMSARRVRFQAGQAHVDLGHKLLKANNLTQALLEFQKAFALDPSSSIAEQEIHRTQQLIEQQKKKSASPSDKPEANLTPAEQAKKQTAEKLNSILPIPELRPLNTQPINLKMNNQPAKVLYETVGKLAGINVLFDSEFTPGKNQSIELSNSTLDQALDYLAVVTKTFWKPLSSNTIFITNDNTTKRRDYEEQVMKVFYLTNVNTAQELQEIVTAVRSVADIQRLFVYNAQMAIVARGEADKIALAEKIIHDLDKPKPEVVVDVLVMETKITNERDLAAAIAPNGITSPIAYNGGKSGTTPPPSTGDGSTPSTSVGAAASSLAIPLNQIAHLSTGDFSVILPGALLQAVMTNSNTRILQSPQVRSLDGQKATLKIGDRVPTATGSFQPGIGGVGINPLVNTQFTYIDVGVNVDITPKIHPSGEIDLHIEADISNVSAHVNLGGIDQPVIGQRKIVHDIRMKEGETNLLGGLMQIQETKTVSGVPGLSSIPVIRRLFTSETVQKDRSELMIALIPHVVRKTEYTPENLRGIAVGNATVVKLNYGPQGQAAPAATPAPATTPATPPAPATTPATPPAPGIPSVPSIIPGAAPPAPPPPPTAPAAPQAPAGIGFTPARVQTKPNATFNVSLMVENVQDLFSAPMSIKWDPTVLRLNDVIKGELLSKDGTQALFTKNILNDTGTATVNLSRPTGAAGVSGSGTLVTLTFQAIKAGSTTVAIPQFTPRNAQSQPIQTVTPEMMVTVQ